MLNGPPSTSLLLRFARFAGFAERTNRSISEMLPRISSVVKKPESLAMSQKEDEQL